MESLWTLKMNNNCMLFNGTLEVSKARHLLGYREESLVYKLVDESAEHVSTQGFKLWDKSLELAGCLIAD